MTLMDLPALAAVLKSLFDTYPTDNDDAERMTLTLQFGGERRVVQLQPGQAAWLTGLLQHEEATCRNAHTDGTGLCAHCHGLGAVGTAGRKPRTWIAWQKDAGGPGTPCTDAASAKAYAAEQYQDGLHWEDRGAAVLVWTGDEALQALEDQGLETGWCVSPETVITPATNRPCPHCGESSDDALVFCPACGRRYRAAD